MLSALLVLAVIGAAAATGQAQSYPTKPIHFVVPFPPGGPLDIMARGIGAKLHGAWGQPVIVENKPGAPSFASGSIGSTGHLAGERFKTMAGVDMVHIPYKGAAPATLDLLAGQTQRMFDNVVKTSGVRVDSSGGNRFTANPARRDSGAEDATGG